MIPNCSCGGKLASERSVPKVDSRLTWREVLHGWGLRWGIGRMRSIVQPGLYTLGNAEPASPVLVTASYSLSFDRLRRELAGIDAWILVLDTKGINVWCAAGKGTFGTTELVHRIQSVDLAEVVTHRQVILPQLGAPGIAAHEVARATGFRVVYGPVRAADLPEFLACGMKASPKMRQVRFNLADRLAVAPIELIQSWKLAVPIILLLVLLRLVVGALSLPALIQDSLPFVGAILLGSVAVPALLPWIPGRSFSWKGAVLGTVGALIWTWLNGYTPARGSAEVLMLAPVVSFLALNFTGATTFTSLSGVKKEMAIALPAIAIAFLGGIALRLILIS